MAIKTNELKKKSREQYLRSHSTALRQMPSICLPAKGWVKSLWNSEIIQNYVAILRAEENFHCRLDLKAAADGDAVDGDYGIGGFGGLQELGNLNAGNLRCKRYLLVVD